MKTKINNIIENNKTACFGMTDTVNIKTVNCIRTVRRHRWWIKVE